jgi:hypothetical protein
MELSNQAKPYEIVKACLSGTNSTKQASSYLRDRSAGIEDMLAVAYDCSKTLRIVNGELMTKPTFLGWGRYNLQEHIPSSKLENYSNIIRGLGIPINLKETTEHPYELPSKGLFRKKEKDIYLVESSELKTNLVAYPLGMTGFLASLSVLPWIFAPSEYRHDTLLPPVELIVGGAIGLGFFAMMFLAGGLVEIRNDCLGDEYKNTLHKISDKLDKGIQEIRAGLERCVE